MYNGQNGSDLTAKHPLNTTYRPWDITSPLPSSNICKTLKIFVFPRVLHRFTKALPKTGGQKELTVRSGASLLARHLRGEQERFLVSIQVEESIQYKKRSNLNEGVNTQVEKESRTKMQMRDDGAV